MSKSQGQLMEIETANKKPPGLEASGPLNPSLLNLDISSLIAIMKQSRTWIEGNLNSMVLHKSPDKQILLNALHEDTEVSSHSASNSVIFNIIEGRMQVETTEETVILEKDQMFTLHDMIKYSLRTLETTVFLLTLVNSSSRKRTN